MVETRDRQCEGYSFKRMNTATTMAAPRLTESSPSPCRWSYIPLFFFFFFSATCRKSMPTTAGTLRSSTTFMKCRYCARATRSTFRRVKKHCFRKAYRRRNRFDGCVTLRTEDLTVIIVSDTQLSASCTLDGCVKIYTSRVDSVATETTKLLGGLATSSSMCL